MTKGIGFIGKFSLILVGALTIIFIILIASYYLANISEITPSNQDLGNLTIFASIFVPLTILIFFDIIKSGLWKSFEYSKSITVIVAMLIIAALYFLFTASSISILGTSTTAIFLLYTSISLSALVLTILITVYVSLF